MTTDQHTADRPVLASTGPAAAPSELSQAFGYADDRSERLDYALGQLDEAINRLTLALEPVMTNGQPYPEPPSDTSPTPPQSALDGRSQVTRRVHGLAVRYDRAADNVAETTARVHRIIEALEV